MSARIIPLAPIREARRDAELRERFGIDPDDTMLPVGLVAGRLIDRLRLRMTEQRNREASR